MRGFHKLSALMFLLMLLTPATVQLLSGGERVSSAEKRTLEPPPSWTGSWNEGGAFLRSMDRFLRDHFGLRRYLVKGWKLLNYAFLYDARARVAIGEQGWLYYLQFWKLKYGARACGPLREDASSFADRVDRLAVRAGAAGLPVVFAVAPDKETIYPEHAPPRLAAGAYCDVVGEIMLALRARRHVRLVDLRAALTEWKAEEQVYFKTDSHWNDSGFLRVSRALLESTCSSRGACTTLPEPSWSARTYSGDLAELLGVGSALSEPSVGAEFPGVEYTRITIDDHMDAERLSTEQLVKRDGTGRALYVIGDSFAKIALRYLIADESVGKVTWSYHGGGRIDFLPIMAERPDAILILIVERSLYDRSLLRAFAADIPK